MTDILRRPEYRRKRKYKARARKRHSFERELATMLRNAYSDAGRVYNLMTPFLKAFKRYGPVPTDNYAGHSVEGAVHPDHTGAVLAHSGDSGRAPSELARCLPEGPDRDEQVRAENLERQSVALGRSILWGGNASYWDVPTLTMPRESAV